jgi:hypothetical protein
MRVTQYNKNIHRGILNLLKEHQLEWKQRVVDYDPTCPFGATMRTLEKNFDVKTKGAYAVIHFESNGCHQERLEEHINSALPGLSERRDTLSKTWLYGDLLSKFFIKVESNRLSEEMYRTAIVIQHRHEYG